MNVCMYDVCMMYVCHGMYMYAYVCMCMYVCIYVCMYVCIRMYVCMYVCMHAYIYITLKSDRASIVRTHVVVVYFHRQTAPGRLSLGPKVTTVCALLTRHLSISALLLFLFLVLIFGSLQEPFLVILQEPPFVQMSSVPIVVVCTGGEEWLKTNTSVRSGIFFCLV